MFNQFFEMEEGPDRDWQQYMDFELMDAAREALFI
jgi:hypothetical protein